MSLLHVMDAEVAAQRSALNEERLDVDQRLQIFAVIADWLDEHGLDEVQLCVSLGYERGKAYWNYFWYRRSIGWSFVYGGQKPQASRFGTNTADRALRETVIPALARSLCDVAYQHGNIEPPRFSETARTPAPAS